MTVFQQGVGSIGTLTATSVSLDGSTATFPYPTQSNGNPLYAGFYSYTVVDGSGNIMPFHAFGIGNANTSQTTPYGIAAFSEATWNSSCENDSWYGTYCSGGQGTKSDYAVTLSSYGQVCLDGTCANVGSSPVDLQTWGSASGPSFYEDDGCSDVGSGEIQCFYTQYGWSVPAYAITADYGSNTASIVNLQNMTLSATVYVGAQPMAVVLDSNNANAYVANSGSSNVTQISLPSGSVIRTIPVGFRPTSITLDPSGTSLWVGGDDYVSNISLSNYSVTSTNSVSGQVTSLSVSHAQNQLVYTTVSDDLSTYEAGGSTTSGSSTTTRMAMSTANTSYRGSWIAVVPPYFKATTAVSATNNNGIAVQSTPTGFQVVDIPDNVILMTGTTPTPVRGIAIDPSQVTAYATLPESNEVITVNLPEPDPAQTNYNFPAQPTGQVE